MIAKELLGLLYSGNGERSKFGRTSVSGSNKIIPEKKIEFPVERRKNFDNQLRDLGLKEDRLKDASLLDVGCGGGDLVFGLHNTRITNEAYGADFEPVIEETKKQLPPEYRGNFFAVNSVGEGTELPKGVKDQRFDIVTFYGVLDPYVKENSIKRLETNIKQVHELMKDDGEARIHPANQKPWEEFLSKYNSKFPQERVLFEFKRSRPAEGPLDVNNKYLLLRKANVHKGRYQC